MGGAAPTVMIHVNKADLAAGRGVGWIDGVEAPISMNSVVQALLCWFHHHNIDTSGWDIRMVRGTPEVRAPYCYDPTRTWRPAGWNRAGPRQAVPRPGSRPARPARPASA
ncbi:MAG TPA: hypothetical protein VLO00_08205 [Cryobacterium sp.]|nr:hypothetical protein [Cryobacterium sp.]